MRAVTKSNVVLAKNTRARMTFTKTKQKQVVYHQTVTLVEELKGEITTRIIPGR